MKISLSAAYSFVSLKLFGETAVDGLPERIKAIIAKFVSLADQPSDHVTIPIGDVREVNSVLTSFTTAYEQLVRMLVGNAQQAITVTKSIELNSVGISLVVLGLAGSIFCDYGKEEDRFIDQINSAGFKKVCYVTSTIGLGILVYSTLGLGISAYSSLLLLKSLK